MPPRAAVLVALALSALSCAKAERDAAPAPVQQRPAEQPASGELPKAPEPEPALPPPPPGQPAADSDDKPKDAPKSTRSREPEPATLAEAEAALAKAKSNLDTLLGTTAVGRGGSATPLASGDPRCESACKAFSSLRRAAAAVCRLAGESNERCARAKALVKANEARVSSCACEPEQD